MRRTTPLFLFAAAAAAVLVTACSKGSSGSTAKPAATDDTPVAKLPPPEVVAHQDPPPSPKPSVTALPRPPVDPVIDPGPVNTHLPVPQMNDGDVTAKGALSAERVKAVLHEMTPPFRYCYGRALRENNQARGSVTVSFTVMRTGIVDGATVVHGTGGQELGDETAETCLVDAFSNLRFPRQNETTQVSYTLVFAPPQID